MQTKHSITQKPLKDAISFHRLSTTVPLKWWQILGPWYVENRFTFPIRRWLVENRLIFKLILLANRLISSRFIELKRVLDGYKKSLGRLTSQEKDGYGLDSQYGYAGDVFVNELNTAHKYKKQIDEGFVGPSESKRLYQHIVATASELLQNSNAPCHFNFGVSYAYTDSILARQFPNTKFYGIERTDASRIYNERFFADIDNLSVLSGDVFDLLSKQSFDGGVFFHSRTLLLLPQDFIRKLYTAARLAGFKYIFGTEQYGISRQTGRSYEFSFRPQDSVIYRDFMYIHNWPNILLDSGFELQKIESIKTHHPHEDYRIMSFQASAM
jgi:hypothetical protein